MDNPIHANTTSVDIELSDVKGKINNDKAISVVDMKQVQIDQGPNSDDFFHRSITTKIEVPNMYTREFIGLYCQYAAVGLIYGTSSAILSLCVYVYNGEPNVCSNATNITLFAWNFKIIFAIITDIFRPYGLRRKPWMIAGWAGVLFLLLILAIFANTLTAPGWIGILMLLQCCIMFSDVPADGYSVELGKIESESERGKILATGQMIRFAFSVLAGFIQAILLNGPTTNSPDCGVSFDKCWSFGLTVNGYYGLLFALVALLVWPIWFMKEIDPSSIPRHSGKHYINEIWQTLQSLTTLYLLIYVIGIGALTNFLSNVNVYMQYYIIRLTNFEAGIDTITSYGALSFAIWVFKTYLINKNMRYTQMGSTIFASVLGLLWILVYFNISGTRNAWFTIFIDLDQSFVNGLSQVLYSMSVIELSKPGLEATTYELVITVGNAALTVSSIIATQLLTPLKVVGCEDDAMSCPSGEVSIKSPHDFERTNGPIRYTRYCLILIFISITCCCIFVQFLPKSKQQCHEWKELGEQIGASKKIGYFSLVISIVTVLYGFIVAILLLNPSSSCLAIVGGQGC